MTSGNHEWRYQGGIDCLRSAERMARLEVDRVVTLSTVGLALPRVLDIGTGSGVFAQACADRGCPVAGIDPNGDLLKVPKKVVPAARFVEASGESEAG